MKLFYAILSLFCGFKARVEQRPVNIKIIIILSVFEFFVFGFKTKASPLERLL